jgi:hypothetical protein
MRGERGGFILTFAEHKHRLVVCASHKQPEPSFLRITPLQDRIGLSEAATIVLQTGSKLYFSEFPVGYFEDYRFFFNGVTFTQLFPTNYVTD